MPQTNVYLDREQYSYVSELADEEHDGNFNGAIRSLVDEARGATADA